MRHVSLTRAAMSVGTVLAAWHAIWAVLVSVGWARPVLDFILELHFVKLSYQLAPYSATTAFWLVVTTFCVGALFGAIFAIVWNWLTFETAPVWMRDTKQSRTTWPAKPQDKVRLMPEAETK